MSLRFLSIVQLGALFALSMACGGGGGGGSVSEPESIKIELVEAGGRSKFAQVDANVPLRIYSDQNRENPKEATHARATFSRLVGGQKVVVAQKTQELQRDSAAPYTVKDSSRVMYFDPLPVASDYILEILLGKNFDNTDENKQEEFYYQGRLENVSVNGSSILIGDEFQPSISIPMSSYNEDSSNVLTVTGFVDFSGVPRSEINRVPFEGFSEVSATSMQQLGAEDAVSFETFNVVLGSTDEFQSYSFQITDIPKSIKGFNIISDAGAPTGMVLNSFISIEDLESGKPIVIDIDTTMANSINNWYLFAITGDIVRDIDVIKKHHARIEKLVAHMNSIVKEISTEGTGNIRLTPAEAFYLAVYYRIYETVTEGDPLSKLTQGIKLNTDVFVLSPSYATQAIEFMIINRAKASGRTVEIEIPDKSNLLLGAQTRGDIGDDLVPTYFNEVFAREAIDQIVP